MILLVVLARLRLVRLQHIQDVRQKRINCPTNKVILISTESSEKAGIAAESHQQWREAFRDVPVGCTQCNGHYQC
jgi:hypothetical protein